VDDFTANNGATMVIPSSHLFDEFPSDSYIEKNTMQITAKRGNFIVLDCMTYHRGGFNQSRKDRYAVNNVYSVPMIRKQIDFGVEDFHYPLDVKSIGFSKINVLGMDYKGHSLASFLQSRKAKMLKKTVAVP